MLTVWGVSLFSFFAVYPAITWFSQENFPPLTPNILLLIWAGQLALHCVALALLISGVSKKQNLGGVVMPLSAVVINQTAASAVYIIVAIVSKYNEKLYYSLHLITDVINKYVPGTVSEQNQSKWLLILCIVHMIIFSAVAVIFYFIERTRQEELLKKGMEPLENC